MSDLRRGLLPTTSTSRYSELDTPRLHLRRGELSEATLETTRPRMHTRIKEVSFLMSRHLSDCQAMAATATRSTDWQAQAASATAAAAAAADTCKTDSASSDEAAARAAAAASRPLKASRRSSVEEERGVANMHAAHACSGCEQTGEAGAVPHACCNCSWDALSQNKIYSELLEVLAAAGVQVSYEETSDPRWRVTHTHTHDRHACATEDSLQHAHHAVRGAYADNATSACEVREQCHMHAEVATGDSGCTASSESASTTADPGDGNCMNSMHAASPVCNVSTPLKFYPSTPEKVEVSNRIADQNSCRPNGAAVATSACGYKHQQSSAQCMAAVEGGGADRVGSDWEGSDEKVLHHLALVQQALDDFMHDTPDADTPGHAVNADAGSTAPSSPKEPATAHATHATHASSTVSSADMVHQARMHQSTDARATHDSHASQNRVYLKALPEMRAINPPAESPRHTSCDATDACMPSDAIDHMHAPHAQRPSVAAADAAAAAVSLQSVANQLRVKDRVWRSKPSPSPRAADRSAVTQHALQRWSTAVDTLQNEQASEHRNKYQQHRLAWWKNKELSSLPTNANNNNNNGASSCAGGGSGDAYSSKASVSACARSEGFHERVCVALRGIQGSCSVAVALHVTVVPAEGDGDEDRDGVLSVVHESCDSSCSQRTVYHENSLVLSAQPTVASQAECGAECGAEFASECGDVSAQSCSSFSDNARNLPDASQASTGQSSITKVMERAPEAFPEVRLLPHPVKMVFA